jgi:opacity protein-like surface antigen
MLRKPALLAAALISGYSVSAMAYDVGPISLNGFGTLGAVHSNLDLADYSSSSFQPDGAGYNHKWSPEVDSVLGLQATANYGKWKAVIQGVTRQTPYDNYRPTIDWLNVSYAFNDKFSARAGRFAMPTYLFSDTRLVHYAMTAVRPSVEVYRLLPVTTADGVDLSYKFSTGAVSHNVRTIWGTNNTHFANHVYGKNRGIWGVFDDMEVGDFTIHTAYQIRQLQLAPSTVAVQPFKIADIGLNYDNGKWFVMTELARTWLRPQLSPSSLAYVINPGMRFGKLTPYLQYAKLDPVPDVLSNGVTRSPASNTKSAGVRWDFYSNFALKAQYDHNEAENGSRGAYVNARPTFPVDASSDQMTVSLDFVF